MCKILKTFLFVCIASIVFACGNLKAPEYAGVKDINIDSFSKDTVVLNAQVIFKNPNRVSGTMFTDQIKVFVNNTDVGYIKNQEVAVPSKADFIMPLALHVPYEELYNNKNGFLGNILNSVLNNSMEIKITGLVTFKKSLFKKTYPVNHTQKIKLLK